MRLENNDILRDLLQTINNSTFRPSKYQSDSTYSVSPEITPATCDFLTFFHKRLRILNQFFTHLSYVNIYDIYARLQIFNSVTSNFNEVLT